ncbi:hypothetical protein EVJ58_g4904 [Rhodofomes roseus]|uniref:Uncharacterized protein n=1 Tax=Rhodofomes roseus TaxID=34475 RepID=A0A4Y9YGI9_9APHY|nr:hypothetical protein EVJ58_g4904 [Rhodofomes roseus]
MAHTPHQSTTVITNHGNAGPSANNHDHLARQYLAVAAEATPELIAELLQVVEWAKYLCIAVEYARAVGVPELEIVPHVNAVCSHLSQSFPNTGDKLPEWAESALRTGFDRMCDAVGVWILGNSVLPSVGIEVQKRSSANSVNSRILPNGVYDNSLFQLGDWSIYNSSFGDSKYTSVNYFSVATPFNRNSNFVFITWE